MGIEKKSKKITVINSIIGVGTRFQGDLNLKELLRIDGDFEGDIHSEGQVLVGRNGRALCRIEADIIVIGGAVKGDIEAKSKIVLLSTAVVIGNIRTPQLVVEEGVLLYGYCTVTRDLMMQEESKLRESAQFSIDWGNPSKMKEKNTVSK